MPCVHNLWLNVEARAVQIGCHCQFADVEAKIVESFDPFRNLPAFVRGERGLFGEFVPQLFITGGEIVADLNDVVILRKHTTSLEVHQLADDIGAGHVDVIETLAVGHVVIEFTGFGVHKVGGEGAGVAPKKCVGEGDVTPEEPKKMKPNHEHGEGIDEAAHCLRPLMLAKYRPVGQRVRKVGRDKNSVQGFAVVARTPGNDGHWFNGRCIEAAKITEHLIFMVGHRFADLLDRDNPVPKAHEADDMAGDAAWQGCHNIFGPILERNIPGQVK